MNMWLSGMGLAALSIPAKPATPLTTTSSLKIRLRSINESSNQVRCRPAACFNLTKIHPERRCLQSNGKKEFACVTNQTDGVQGVTCELRRMTYERSTIRRLTISIVSCCLSVRKLTRTRRGGQGVRHICEMSHAARRDSQ